MNRQLLMIILSTSLLTRSYLLNNRLGLRVLSRFKEANRGLLSSLNDRNQHEKDKLMQFDPVSHKYRYDGQLMKCSVTQLVDRYFEAFNEEEVAIRMMSGPNWPRTEYTHPNGDPFTLEEILASWKTISVKALREGTSMHESIEKYLDGYTTSPSTPEYRQFLSFVSEYLTNEQIEPYRTEWRIAAPNIGLAGSVDFVGRYPNGSFVLIDWKRSRHAEGFFSFRKNDSDKSTTSISPSSNNYSLTNKDFLKRAKRPVTNLYDCTEMKYSLQLNLYSYILANYYGLNVSKMVIVAFHPQLPNYVVNEAPLLQNEVHEIICDFITSRSKPR